MQGSVGLLCHVTAEGDLRRGLTKKRKHKRIKTGIGLGSSIRKQQQIKSLFWTFNEFWIFEKSLIVPFEEMVLLLLI